jgi:hypothetical protein
VRKLKKGVFVLFLLSGLVIACGSAGSELTLTATPMPTVNTSPTQALALTASRTKIPPPRPTYTQTTPAIPIAEGLSISSINILIPEISPASEIIDTSNITSFFLQEASPLAIALDDKSVYWVNHNDPSILYRISQSGGTPEVLTRSLYETGRLDCIDLQTSEHWLILCDTDTPGIPGNWKVRAINLDDLSQTVLLSSDDNAPIVFSSFGISLNNNSVLWAGTTIKGNEIDENVVSFVNLETGESHELLREKADKLVTWMLGLSGDQAVVQQEVGEPLYLLDLTNGKTSDLLTYKVSAWPGFSFPWVLWTQLEGSDYMKSFVVYNLVDDQKFRVFSKGSLPGNPKITGSRVYWKDQPINETGNAIYIYDIDKNATFILAAPETNQLYEAIYIHDNIIAWVRNTNYLEAGSDRYLEWTAIQ